MLLSRRKRTEPDRHQLLISPARQLCRGPLAGRRRRLHKHARPCQADSIGTMRWLSALVIPSAACWICIATTYAECITPWDASMMQRPDAEFVVDATAVKLRTAGIVTVATLQIHRVFKGSLPAQLELYNWGGSAQPQLESAGRYLVAITRSTAPVPEIATSIALEPNARMYSTIACGAVRRSAIEAAGTLGDFGPGWPPTR
jgi:hypothetical protein